MISFITVFIPNLTPKGRPKNKKSIQKEWEKSIEHRLNKGGPVPDLWIGIDSYGWIGGIDRATA